ncbi:ScpA family protein [Marivibrio halodurans]|uniref:segregation and condensation protein A n=1 Tax=Marivibrio halodurans TaxID=2039722 RepID=UPI0031BB94FD
MSDDLPTSNDGRDAPTPGAAAEPFDTGGERVARPEEELVVDIDGFEGPIDLLLNLAREQKVDLARISILQLADQYLGYIERARTLQLEIAADYLVMAAWLAYLKSRILLPKPEVTEESEDPAEMAARLAFQLQRLEAMQNISKELMRRTQLGQDFFARGMPETLKVERTPRFEDDLYDMLKAYGEIRARQVRSGQLRILPTRLYSMEQALSRLRHIIGDRTDWQMLEVFLPPEAKGDDLLLTRSTIAGTFAAMLELTREGLAEVRQSGTFQPIYVRGVARKRNETLKGEEIPEEDSARPRSDADSLEGLDDAAIGALLDEEDWGGEDETGGPNDQASDDAPEEH